MYMFVQKKDVAAPAKAAPVSDSGAKSGGANLLDLDFLGGGPVQQQQQPQQGGDITSPSMRRIAQLQVWRHVSWRVDRMLDIMWKLKHAACHVRCVSYA